MIHMAGFVVNGGRTFGPGTHHWWTTFTLFLSDSLHFSSLLVSTVGQRPGLRPQVLTRKEKWGNVDVAESPKVRENKRSMAVRERTQPLERGPGVLVFFLSHPPCRSLVFSLSWSGPSFSLTHGGGVAHAPTLPPAVCGRENAATRRMGPDDKFLQTTFVRESPRSCKIWQAFWAWDSLSPQGCL